jgi:hypothetical protein
MTEESIRGLFHGRGHAGFLKQTFVLVMALDGRHIDHVSEVRFAFVQIVEGIINASDLNLFCIGQNIRLASALFMASGSESSATWQV